MARPDGCHPTTSPRGVAVGSTWVCEHGKSMWRASPTGGWDRVETPRPPRRARIRRAGLRLVAVTTAALTFAVVVPLSLLGGREGRRLLALGLGGVTLVELALGHRYTALLAAVLTGVVWTIIVSSTVDEILRTVDERHPPRVTMDAAIADAAGPQDTARVVVRIPLRDAPAFVARPYVLIAADGARRPEPAPVTVLEWSVEQ